ncbi:MAG: YidC/Oxa1 family membrane protein insertase [Candidatus Levyibacteriota bacterium]
MTDPGLYNQILIWPITNIMLILYQMFYFLHLPYALGFAIIAMTVIIRIILYPLTNAQLKTSKRMQDLAPHIAKLKEAHKNDSKRLQTETMRLYKEHGVNPAAGCLPVLVQFPFIIALYQSIFTLFNQDFGLTSINKILYSFVPPLDKMPDLNFFGYNLAHKPNEFSQYGPLLFLIPIITVILSFIQSKMMPFPVKKYSSDSSKEKKEKQKSSDFASTMQTQMIYMMPLMIGFFSWQFPVGVSLYWNTFTVFGIIQQYKISGLGSLEGIVNKIYVKK